MQVSGDPEFEPLQGNLFSTVSPIALICNPDEKYLKDPLKIPELAELYGETATV